MEHIMFLLLNHLPAEVDDALEAEGLVVLLPSVADEDGVGLGEGFELEF